MHDQAMDEVEARSVLGDELRTLRRCTREALVERLVDRQETKAVTGSSGTQYQIELQAFWDDPKHPGEVLRVMGAIDDGQGWRANVPLTDDFLVAADGSIVVSSAQGHS